MLTAGTWGRSPIRNCPGRYVLNCSPDVTPEQVAGAGVRITEHCVPAARDPVLVAALDEGGLISYRHPDGTFTHTVNDAAGFRRKLHQLGIEPPV